MIGGLEEFEYHWKLLTNIGTVNAVWSYELGKEKVMYIQPIFSIIRCSQVDNYQHQVIPLPLPS